MNLKKRLVLGENGSSAGKLLGRITGIGRADTTDVEAVYRHYATKREE